MELWDVAEEYESNTMPTYKNEELQQVREKYVCDWILDVDNVRRDEVLQDLALWFSDTPALLRQHSGGHCKGPAQGRKRVGGIETQNAPLVGWVGGKTMPSSLSANAGVAATLNRNWLCGRRRTAAALVAGRRKTHSHSRVPALSQASLLSLPMFQIQNVKTGNGTSKFQTSLQTLFPPFALVGPTVLRYCDRFVSAWWCVVVFIWPLFVVCIWLLSRCVLGVAVADTTSCLVNLAGQNQLLGELGCLLGVLPATR
ncbi:uncharacterized protein HKW66_Vig0246510 [Vigna angularis]|uniref:Uncharacterized protein n=1 Tax=Phaseolus angularis TaxID=3914 RepID=A0A8T0KES4_PHAAN|nr:uncharacterized protein HKW66_Vig0246510 [Vigna angularis]